MGNEPVDTSLKDSTLESNDTIVEKDESMSTVVAAPGEAPKPAPEAKPADPSAPKVPRHLIKRFFAHFNIYLLLFVLMLMVVGLLTLVLYRKDTTTKVASTTIDSQTLSDDAIKSLSNTDTTIGDAKQTLNVESNAVFTGKVLIRDTLDVAGSIRVGGPLSLPGITVSGTSNFDQIIANKLNISGDTTVSGSLNIQKNLTVTGGASFGGALSAPQLNIEKLQLSQDIQLNRHIDAGGGTPRASSGTGAGVGGTASVSGSDTAGTVTINTGSSPPAGVLATITFAASYAASPHVVITPVGPGGAALNYYIARTNTGFTIFSGTAAAGGASFSFDYIVID